MNRWVVKIPDSGRVLKYYANTADDVRRIFPDAISIRQISDDTYIEFVGKISDISSQRMLDYKGREVWEIPYNGGRILYRQFVDDNGDYLDGCEFQRWDINRKVLPLLWTISTPRDFFESFLDDEIPQVETQVFVSINELKRRHAKKIWNKDGVAYWEDPNGLFYQADKACLPTKKDREFWQEFNGNSNAVFASWGTEVAFRKRRWFSSIEAFMEFFSKEAENLPPAMGTLRYEILRKGYKRPHPDDRKLVLSLPYINLEKEVHMSRREYADTKKIVDMVSKSWQNRMTPSKFGWDFTWLDEMVSRLISVYSF